MGRDGAEGQHRLFVVELDDAVGPRRRPDRPNLHVGTTVRDPAEHYSRIKQGSKRHRLLREHGVRLRQDLVSHYPPTTAADIARQKRKIINKLMRRAYAVNGDRRVWNLYVIELDDGVGPRADPAMPWVYVGQTSIDVQERFRQHVDGVRSAKGHPLYSKWAHRHGVDLRPDLYEDESPCYTLEDALTGERLLGARLERLGYSVKGAH